MTEWQYLIFFLSQCCSKTPAHQAFIVRCAKINSFNNIILLYWSCMFRASPMASQKHNNCLQDVNIGAPRLYPASDKWSRTSHLWRTVSINCYMSDPWYATNLTLWCDAVHEVRKRVYHWILLRQIYRPRVGQGLDRPLGVREAGVRSPTASHQRREKWEVCASQLGAWH